MTECAQRIKRSGIGTGAWAGECLAMTDIVGKAQRSRMMAAVRQANTDPEQRVRRCLTSLGARYSAQARGLPGTPDLLLSSARVAVFVHGCFWHRHPGCRLTTTPTTRAGFWTAKFADNVRRDRQVTRRLRRAGWGVWVVWQCQTRDAEALKRRLHALLRAAMRRAA